MVLNTGIKSYITVFVLFLLSMLVYFQTAHACMSTTEEQREDFQSVDHDKNSYVSLDEYYSKHPDPESVSVEDKQKHFSEIDLNKDGQLDFDEYSAIRRRLRC